MKRNFVFFVCLLMGAGTTSAQQREETIRLHPQNPHYFLYRGKAVALVSSAEHYGAVINSEFDYHKYLSALAAAGMNYTRLFGGSYVEAPGKSFGIRRNDLAPEAAKFVAPWARSSEPGYAGGGNKLDLSKWNAEYFSRLHDFWERRRGWGLWSRSGCSLRSMGRCSGICLRSCIPRLST